jgi:hypothetical protein
MDLLAISVFLVSDSVVFSSVALGVLVAVGLVIREKSQGAEDMKQILKQRAEAFDAHNAMYMSGQTDRG